MAEYCLNQQNHSNRETGKTRETPEFPYWIWNKVRWFAKRPRKLCNAFLSNGLWPLNHREFGLNCLNHRNFAPWLENGRSSGRERCA